jgi:hypothetical protein
VVSRHPNSSQQFEVYLNMGTRNDQLCGGLRNSLAENVVLVIHIPLVEKDPVIVSSCPKFVG